MRAVLIFALAVALLLPAAAGADPIQQGIVIPHVPPETPPVELGQQLFAGNCATCHGADAQGIPGRGPSLRIDIIPRLLARSIVPPPSSANRPPPGTVMPRRMSISALFLLAVLVTNAASEFTPDPAPDPPPFPPPHDDRANASPPTAITRRTRIMPRPEVPLRASCPQI